MFENVDGPRPMDARVTGILLAHRGAFGSGELKTMKTVREGVNDVILFSSMI